MRCPIALSLAALVFAGPAAANGTGTPSDAVCVVNASEHSHVFVAEARGAERKMTQLAPGERLCAHGATAQDGGVVSVFEDEDSFEGCSKVLESGQTEFMKEYVDFDRCFWDSNT